MVDSLDVVGGDGGEAEQPLPPGFGHRIVASEDHLGRQEEVGELALDRLQCLEEARKPTVRVFRGKMIDRRARLICALRRSGSLCLLLRLVRLDQIAYRTVPLPRRPRQEFGDLAVRRVGELYAGVDRTLHQG